ncbi:hypothetical protein Tco_1361513 [Tanacetum coccineum]
MTARISIRDKPSISLPPSGRGQRLLAILKTINHPPPPLPLTSTIISITTYTSQHSNDPTYMRIPKVCYLFGRGCVLLLPPLDRGRPLGFVDMVDVPPRCSTSRELDYDITDTWDDLVGAIDEIAPTTVEGVNQRVYRSLLPLLRIRLPAYVMSTTYNTDSSGTECIDFRVTVSRSQETRRLQSYICIRLTRDRFQLTKDIEVAEIGLQQNRWSSCVGSMNPQKVHHRLMHQQSPGSTPRFGYGCSYAMQPV